MRGGPLEEHQLAMESMIPISCSTRFGQNLAFFIHFITFSDVCWSGWVVGGFQCCFNVFIDFQCYFIDFQRFSMMARSIPVDP